MCISSVSHAHGPGSCIYILVHTNSMIVYVFCTVRDVNDIEQQQSMYIPVSHFPSPEKILNPFIP